MSKFYNFSESKTSPLNFEHHILGQLPSQQIGVYCIGYEYTKRNGIPSFWPLYLGMTHIQGVQERVDSHHPSFGCCQTHLPNGSILSVCFYNMTGHSDTNMFSFETRMRKYWKNKGFLPCNKQSP